MSTCSTTGGGTGGHLFPALAIGEEITNRDPNINIHYVGSNFGFFAYSGRIAILERQAMQVAWRTWRTPTLAAQADDQVDGVPHAARNSCRSSASCGRDGYAAQSQAGSKRAIFVKRTSAVRLSCKREQRSASQWDFCHASRRAVPDHPENMPDNGIGFTGEISGTTSTPK